MKDRKNNSPPNILLGFVWLSRANKVDGRLPQIAITVGIDTLHRHTLFPVSKSAKLFRFSLLPVQFTFSIPHDSPSKQ